MQKDYRYVLITAARNEESYIENTIKAVLNQSLPPLKWIIVDDGSHDQTGIIIKRYAEQNARIIYMFRKDTDHQGNFASKVFALNLGYKNINELNLDYEFIGHLDADITFDSRYYEKLLEFFKEQRGLGIAGGFIYEMDKGVFKNRVSNTKTSVAGGIQLFRKKCYEDVGGLLPLAAGGEDSYAEVSARQKGWIVESFPQLIAYHHHKSSRKRGVVKDAFRGGITDYILGNHPVFEIFKCLRRMKEKPYLIVAGVRYTGFLWMNIMHPPRPVTKEFIKYLRAEQLARLRTMLFSLL